MSSHRQGLGGLLLTFVTFFTACGSDDGARPDASAPRDAARGDAPDAGESNDGAASLDGSAADAPTSDGATVDTGVFTGTCPATLAFVARGVSPRVFAAGAWNGFSDTADELVDDGTGRYTTTLELAPGLYPYKLVVDGDGGERWRLDPDNPYRAFEAGVENSGLRVDDCTTPALVVDETSHAGHSGEGAFRASLRYDARRAGTLASVTATLEGPTSRPLDPSELTREGDVLRVSVAGLANGKYTVRVVATAAGGSASEPTLLPFWIEARPFDWDGALVYLAMPDRFRNGDPSNDPAPTDASTGADFHGGDLDGLAAALREGYFDELGVGALWVTPWVPNPTGTFVAGDEVHRVTGYHGYWPIEPFGVDARFGGESALREVVREAHARGIRVLMDLVVNHVHEQHPYYRDHPGWFSAGCLCGSSGCDWTERRLDCLFRPYMPDVDWTNAEASEQLLSDAMEWLERFDLDGFRVDAVKHVVDAAIQNLSVRVRERFETAGTRYFLMGETAQGWDPSAGPDEGQNPREYGIISQYIGEHRLDGQFDFVLYYAGALQFLRDEPGRGMAHIDFWTKASLDHYPADAVMTPYLGSHDTARFVSLAATPERAWRQWDELPPKPADRAAYDRMYVAFGWLLALPGAPLLYQGDEYGEFGGSDPDNRHLIRFGDDLDDVERAQLDRVRALGRARYELPGLKSRTYRTLYADESTLVTARGSGDDTVIVVIHRGAAGRTLSVGVPREVAAEGTSLVDRAGSGETAVVRRASLEWTVEPWTVRYFAREPH